MSRKIPSFLLLSGAALIIIMLLSSGIVSAGWLDWVKTKITGKLTSQPFNMSVAVGNNAPQIPSIFLSTSSIYLVENNKNDTIINFSAHDSDGWANLNDASAKVNITDGTMTRTNSSCVRYQQSGNNTNYSCTISIWYFDAPQMWNITAFIQDVSSASGSNTSNLTINQLVAFVMGPSALTFSGATVTPGNNNVTSNNDPLLLNNTGNANIASGSVQVNATNLRGETTSTLAIWAANMSVGTSQGGNPPTECGGAGATNMASTYAYTAVAGSALSRGNYSGNDGSTGQEQLYVCIRTVGSELTSQTYSTLNSTEGSWTVKIN
jgi:hypothetical protein